MKKSWKFESIKKNDDFKRVYLSKKKYVGAYLIMYVDKVELDNVKIGITVSKKIGKAVVRNRARRLIKESIRLNQTMFSKKHEYVFVARGRISDANYIDVEKNVKYLIGKFKREN